MEKRLENVIKGIGYEKMSLDRNLVWLRESPNHGLNEEGVGNVIRFLLREVHNLGEQVKGLKDFYYGFDVVTESDDKLNAPKIGWVKGECMETVDRDMHHKMAGFSEDGREWEGTAIYCLGDIVSYPLEDGYLEEVVK